MGSPELPVFKKCCCCVPLRYGLITWGYIRVIIAIIVAIGATRLCFELFLASVFSKNDSRVQYLIFTMLAAFLVVTSVIDVILNVIFIVSGHQKDKNLMRGYYVYSILLCVLTTGMFVAGAAYVFFMYASTQNVLLHDVYLLLMFIVFILFQISVQGYAILLVRSEIIKLRSNSQFRFVNNSGESECCMKGEEEVALGTEATENNCKGNAGAKGTCEFVGYVARNNEY